MSKLRHSITVDSCEIPLSLHQALNTEICMYVIQFSSQRIVEFANPHKFEAHAKRWLSIREAENTYLFAALETLKEDAETRAHGGEGAGARMFVVEDSGAVVAAGMLTAAGELSMTWATPEMIETLADHAARAGWQIASVYAPEHVAWAVATAHAQRAGMRVKSGKAERIYQLARARYALPAGKLEPATAADRDLLRPWFHHFAGEVSLEVNARETETALDTLVGAGLLYLWKSPEAVAMAAWVSPTPQGASMSYVYAPPEYRGRGYGKAVAAALGAHLLGRGLKYCFIHTDSNDRRSNHVYQAIGANAVCEVLRCTLHPASEPVRRAVREPMGCYGAGPGG